MSDNEQLIFKLLKELSEEEFEKLSYSEDSSERKALLKSLIQIDARWISVLPLLAQYLKEQSKNRARFEANKTMAWHKLQPKLNEPKPLFSWNKLQKYGWQIAASLILLYGGTFFYKNYQSNQFKKSYKLAAVWKTKEIGSSMILLPDSTRVWLNKESSIAYIIAEGSSRRQVKVTGEAYFEVKASEQKPFDVIHTNGVLTVTGTRFFAGNDRIEGFYVDLLEGKVSFQSYGFMPKKIALAPRQKLSYLPSADRNQLEILKSESAPYLWLRKPINFSNVPLPKLIKQLNAWYETDIILSDKALERLHFSGILSPEESLKTNLEKITWTSKLSFVHQKNQILIKSTP
ncbi:MAG: DUF4974 domain-containing protein [Flavobacteriales bacterium]|nr:MAG: DUF4974 domain-containing protein [Flavobacteriales bacterium]